MWDFYRNAVHRPDQLRQRVALALSELLVVSNVEVEGTYWLAHLSQQPARRRASATTAICCARWPARR
jgi:hypothetical protein